MHMEIINIYYKFATVVLDKDKIWYINLICLFLLRNA